MLANRHAVRESGHGLKVLKECGGADHGPPEDNWGVHCCDGTGL